MCPPHAMTEVDPDDFGDIPDAPVAADTVIVCDVGEHVLAVRHGVPFDDEDMGAGRKARSKPSGTGSSPLPRSGPFSSSGYR
jgi:hypothetical protein